jgi:hypothetical protein
MIQFNEERHEYKLDGKVIPSVSQLLKKHGLTVDYSMVPEAILSAKAERGTLIHKEIQDYIEKRELGFTKECRLFSDWLEQNPIADMKCEQIVNNEVCAGKFDLLGRRGDKMILIDFKTTSSKHLEDWRWQLSLYDYLLGCGSELHVLWMNDGLEDIKIDKMPDAEIERLFDAERNGEPYKPAALVFSTESLSRIEDLERQLFDFKTKTDAIEKKKNELLEGLKNAMESQKIKSLDYRSISITYIAPSKRVTFDKKKFETEHPEMKGMYEKESNVKSSIRIKLHEVDTEVDTEVARAKGEIETELPF